MNALVKLSFKYPTMGKVMDSKIVDKVFSDKGQLIMQFCIGAIFLYNGLLDGDIYNYLLGFCWAGFHWIDYRQESGGIRYKSLYAAIVLPVLFMAAVAVRKHEWQYFVLAGMLFLEWFTIRDYFKSRKEYAEKVADRLRKESKHA